jgi:hypothetical protein
MSPTNGQGNGPMGSAGNLSKSVPPAVLRAMSPVPQFTSEQIQEFVALLEVPFDSSVIEWRVTNTSKGNGRPRGQVIPYADPRAYTDRLNALFTPAGWTRTYAVSTSANFQRSRDQKTTAKVFVTCALTIFGIGSHSATGEQWTDDDNAGTSAEAQAFKRASSCFGLGRYLYSLSGIWVDLDDRKRPKTPPKLPGWATPEGWCQGPRPYRGEDRQLLEPATEAVIRQGSRIHHNSDVPKSEPMDLVRQIEAMAEPLGRRLYRGLLKTVARAWKPDDIKDTAVLRKLLSRMEAASRGLRRLEAALDKTGSESLVAILRSLNVKSLDQVDNLELLHEIVIALEARDGLVSVP